GTPARSETRREVDRAQLEDALEKLTRSADLFNKGLQFRIHDKTGRLIVRVIDRETEEVIRDIPPERILDLVASIEAFLGLLFEVVFGGPPRQLDRRSEMEGKRGRCGEGADCVPLRRTSLPLPGARLLLRWSWVGFVAPRLCLGPAEQRVEGVDGLGAL